MTIKQLLGGAAVAALLAGAAQAAPVSVPVTAAGDAGPQNVANEYSGAFAGALDLVFAAEANPFTLAEANADIRFDVTLTNARFTSVIASTPALGGGNCALSTIQRGGGVEGTTVGFNFIGSPVTGCAFPDPTAIWSLPIERVNPAATVSVAVAFTCEANCGGFTTLGDSYQLTFGRDAYPASGRSVTEGSAITLSADGIEDEDVVLTLGSVTYTFINSAAAAAPAPAGDINTTASAQIVNANAVDSATLRLSFPEGISGIKSAAVATGGECSADAANNRFNCSLDAAQLAALSTSAITIVADGDDPIEQQTPTVEIIVESEDDYNVPGLAAANLAPISWDDGLNTDVPNNGNATFEWVGLATGSTGNAFRVTGLPTNLSENGACIQVQATRSNVAIQNTGWQCVNANITASVGDTWTATFAAGAIRAALGTSAGNADLEFRIRRDDDEGADNDNNGTISMRRLYTSGGVVTGTGFDN